MKVMWEFKPKPNAFPRWIVDAFHLYFRLAAVSCCKEKNSSTASPHLGYSGKSLGRSRRFLANPSPPRLPSLRRSAKSPSLLLQNPGSFQAILTRDKQLSRLIICNSAASTTWTKPSSRGRTMGGHYQFCLDNAFSPSSSVLHVTSLSPSLHKRLPQPAPTRHRRHASEGAGGGMGGAVGGKRWKRAKSESWMVTRG